MCIYCGTSNYRKIYEHHVGPIPKDEDGRTYDIHHIDGDHSNNNISNLKAITLQEHYDIHLSQGDYRAAHLISIRLRMSPEEISRLSKLAIQQQIMKDNHPWRKAVNVHVLRLEEDEAYRNTFINSIKEMNYRRVQDGTHHFLGGEIQRRTSQKRLDNGTHHFLGGEIAQRINKEKVDNGTHNFLGKHNPTHERVKQGTHQFVTKVTCPHCNKVGQTTNMNKYHFDNCKIKTNKNKFDIPSNHPSYKESQCPYCHKTGKGGIMSRWHFDKCRHKPKD